MEAASSSSFCECIFGFALHRCVIEAEDKVRGGGEGEIGGRESVWLCDSLVPQVKDLRLSFFCLLEGFW